MEEKNIEELLNEEIAAQIEALSDLQSGTKEKSTAIDDLTKLYKLRIEENKSVWDADEKYNRRIMDGESVTKDGDFKERQIAEQVKDRYFRVGIAAAELLIPLMCYGIWMNKGFKFEETGTFTSSTFKGLINRFRPTKKQRGNSETFGACVIHVPFVFASCILQVLLWKGVTLYEQNLH